MARARSRIAMGLGLTAVLLSIVVLPGAPSSADSRGLTAGPVQRPRVEDGVLSKLRSDGKATYWVVLRERADLGGAHGMKGDARGRFVVDRLRETADRSQAGLRGLLKARGADFTPFWAANVVRVTSDEATLDAIAARGDIEAIEADRVYEIPDPRPGVVEAAIQGIEWNLSNVRAPEVWSTFGTRGEGIVVGTIDTGVQYDHPALVGQYRGNLGGGQFDHNYNWYDPAEICGEPSLAPCDNHGHGTHTMGTIAGDDGGANRIGVAPGARFIAAKGCESSACSTTALLLAGQWMLAPTDLAGQNPRPDLRPNVISNSWSAGIGNNFYRQVVQSWVAAGIFPVFGNGNTGPACGTASSPGDYAESYGVGAHDSANLVASFSGRGPSAFGPIKPDISAPGVNVRSSLAGSGYGSYSGTSMATPHVAGAVALMWGAAPSLAGDVATTRAILDRTAIDSADASCGGTPADNNAYGEGRLDAYSAVEQSPRGPTGILEGTVTDAATGLPLAGVEVAASGPFERSTTTSAAGAYAMRIPVGSYDVTAHVYGFLARTAAGVAVAEGAVTVQNIALPPAPPHALTGTVRDIEGNVLAGATVTILGTPIPPSTTNAAGAYSFPSVPEGTYELRAQLGRCTDPQNLTVSLGGDRTLDFALPPRADAFGYSCRIEPQAWIAGTTVLALTGDDASVAVTLPFRFDFYGGRFTTANVSTNGFITFEGPGTSHANVAIPSASEPSTAVYALWDDLLVDASSSVRTVTVGKKPQRQFVIEWQNVAFQDDTASRVDFEILLDERGEIVVQYRNIAPGSLREQGNSATIGLESPAGSDALQYGFGEPVVTEGLSLRYAVRAFTGVEGFVTDANDGLSLFGAAVRVLQGGAEVQRATLGTNGFYRFYLAAESYTIEASKTNYESRTSSVSVRAGSHQNADFLLRTPRAVATPDSLVFSQIGGRVGTQTLTVSNTGTLPMTWRLSESGGDVRWLSETVTSGSLSPGGSQDVQVAASSAGLLQGNYHAALYLESNSGREPSVMIPVTLLVTRYNFGINAGGPEYWDVSQTYWSADAPWAAGGAGYTNARSNAATTKQTIAGTTDPKLFQSVRVAPVEYRFDGLPAGNYQVTVSFAEYIRLWPGARVFDVSAEGTTFLPAHDVAAHAPVFTADAHTFTVAVTDGQLNLLFTPRPGSVPPIVCAIRVTQAP